MSRARFANLSEDRRDRLLETAAEEFVARGYEGASLNRILEQSGMSKSSLYYYFDDKADLFTTLLERGLALMLARIGRFEIAALTAETFWPELERFYRSAVALESGEGWVLKLGQLFYRLRAAPQPPDPTGRIMTAVRGWVADLLQHGQKLGAVRDDLPLPLLLDCAMGVGEALDRWVVNNIEGLDTATRRRVAAEHIDLLKRLLAP